VHRTLGPRFERTALARDAGSPPSVRGSSSYSEISGARPSLCARGSPRRWESDPRRGTGAALVRCERDPHSRVGRSRSGDGERIPGMKVLVIGLDGADWNILDPLLQAGKLPNLDRLARTGVRGRLRTITPMLSPLCGRASPPASCPLATASSTSWRLPPAMLRKCRHLGPPEGQGDLEYLSDAGVSVGVVAWWGHLSCRGASTVSSCRTAWLTSCLGPTWPRIRRGREGVSSGSRHVLASLTVASRVRLRSATSLATCGSQPIQGRFRTTRTS